MKRKKEEVPGFDEIIFENRNKEYGAYELRKRYNKTESYSILGGIITFLMLVFGLTLSLENDGSANVDHTLIVVKVDPIDPNILKVKEPEIPAIPPVRNRFIAPKVVDDTSQITSTLDITDNLIDSTKNRNVSDTSISYVEPDPIIPVTTEPSVWVEEMPSFPGGNEELLKLISGSIKYPQEAIDNNIQGKVTIRFVVASNGSVERAEILRGVHPVLDKEALRVVSSLPKWKPGKQNGIAVPVWFFVPVTFKLRNN